jgi:hypothetical protein
VRAKKRVKMRQSDGKRDRTEQTEVKRNADVPTEDDRKLLHICRSPVACERNIRCTSTCTFAPDLWRNFCESFCLAFSIFSIPIDWTICSIDSTTIDRRSHRKEAQNRRSEAEELTWKVVAFRKCREHVGPRATG